MAGATVAVFLRLWGERDDWVARLLLWLMGIPGVLALQVIALSVTTWPRGSTKFNWKFRIAWAITNLLMDVCMTVFAAGIIKKRKKK